VIVAATCHAFQRTFLSELHDDREQNLRMIDFVGYLG